MIRDDGHVPIRSFRNCFKMERRIHRVDRWRLPVPFGVPVRGIAYALVAFLTIVVLGYVPGVRLLIGTVPAEVRFAVAPIGIAFGLVRWEVDGRPGHALVRSWIRMRTQPRRVVAWRSAKPPKPREPVRLGVVTMVPDHRTARLRPAIVRGPASVVVRYPFTAVGRGRKLRINQAPGPARWQGKQVALEPDQRLRVR